MHDGDTIAIGGLIGDTTTTATNGIPFLSRLPYIGGLFGSHTYQHERTELILFMTPHVIYDTTDLLQASDELKAKVTKLQRFIKTRVRKINRPAEPYVFHSQSAIRDAPTPIEPADLSIPCFRLTPGCGGARIVGSEPRKRGVPTGRNSNF